MKTQITIAFDEDILTGLVRQAVASVLEIDLEHEARVRSSEKSNFAEQKLPDGTGQLIPRATSRRLRQSASAAPPSNATTEQLIAYLQANVDKLGSRLEEIYDLVAGRSKEHLTVAEVAEMTGRSAYTVRRWISDGRLTASRVSNTGKRGRLLIHRDELRRLISGGPGQNV